MTVAAVDASGAGITRRSIWLSRATTPFTSTAVGTVRASCSVSGCIVTSATLGVKGGIPVILAFWGSVPGEGTLKTTTCDADVIPATT